ncbi:Fungal specific transcription factor domain-containing protein 17 [Elsinoe fawcettii]|nr:Fungal specific transcription factor domain-containing protein 17 [Elsinoe fawcettii]
MADNSKATGYSAGFTRVDAIEQCVQPHGLRLVNLFFRNVHPAYPVVCREAFTRAYLKTYRNIAPPLLGAVYLAALQRWAYDTDLAVHDPPDARILRQLTLDAIQRCYHAPHLWSIQAVLLLLQCQSEDPLNPDHTFAAGLTAQAIAVGHCLGLHLDASSWTIPLWEKNVRKRLSWALLMQDRWTALAYGRPLHIHEDDWGVRDLELTDFTDRVTTDEGMQHDQSNNAANAAHDAGATTTTDVNALETTGSVLFMKMAELTQILTRILSSFYSLKGSLEQDTLALYKTAEPILLSLREFEAELPPSLNLGARYQRQLSFHGNLWALYYGVRIALLRRIVRSIALPPECSDDLVLSTVRQEALSVVREATSFVYELRPDQLQGFWYFAVPYIFSLMGSFTTVLLVTSLSTQERSFWQDTLNTYLWHLKFSSSSSDAMKYAVNRLESAVLRGMEHALAVNDREPLGGTITPPTVLPRTELDFADFGVWDLATEDLGIFDFLNMDSIT